jgi:hypothetical protein
MIRGWDVQGRSRRRLRGAAALVLSAVLLAAATPAMGDRPPPGVGLRDGLPPRIGPAIAVISDVPQSEAQAALLSGTLDEIGHESDLLVHLGNLKGENERCDDSLYLRRRDLLDGSLVPLVLLPGDNDWADCALRTGGGFAPFERLTRLRELFFERPDSLGATRIALSRQSQTSRFRGYPENARWLSDGLLFVTVNVPGGQNNFQRGAGRNGELEERALANAAWLRQAFALAGREDARAVIVAFHGDPNFTRLDANDRNDAYGAFKQQLAQLAGHFKGQVLLLHGSDKAVQDQPLAVGGKRLANVMRVGVHNSRAGESWLHIEYQGGRTPGFVVHTRNTARRP